MGPDDQVVGEHHDLQPYLVERELFERELGQAGVLIVADAILDVRVLAVASLDRRDVGVGLVFHWPSDKGASGKHALSRRRSRQQPG